jgi:hypothetical protein
MEKIENQRIKSLWDNTCGKHLLLPSVYCSIPDLCQFSINLLGQ